uniref:Uncharacterized protein n=1 Tax=viral metagenome TaxID=1070528 RepID=A0A6M3LQ74_9ZZZZ
MIITKIDFIIMLIVAFIIIISASFNFYNYGYRTGQIDAINGNIKYELVTDRNKITQWEKIKEK